jgi:ABC-type bacteriocin/lantibiotic exporter with double-glycine peptidase domain
MDCGPAALTCLLRGFHLAADYARLRQACQTDVDGTSIDRIEEVAGQLGLEAEQVMVPADHLPRPEAGLLPALVVVLLPGGITHFVVLWRAHGPLAQIMDPGTGRQFTRLSTFMQRLLLHTHEVDAAEWREWAGSGEFLAPLRGRMAALHVPAALAAELVDAALADEGWRAVAALDATVRQAAALVEDGGLRPGQEAGALIKALVNRAHPGEGPVPARHWSVLPRPEGRLALRGALLIRLRGRAHRDEEPAALPPSLAGALQPRRGGLLARLWPLLKPVRGSLAAAVGAATAIAAGAAAVEALLLNGLLHSGVQRLGRIDQLVLLLGVAGFAGLVLALDWISGAGALRLGRSLECAFRVALLEKLPRIADRHLGTWLRSDLAERAHAVALLRELPSLAVSGFRAAGEIAITAVAVLLLYPGGAAGILGAAVAAIAIPLLAQPLLAERDVRLRSLEGALSRHYLDALVGATAARAHAAEDILRREHNARLEDWQRAGVRLQGALVATEAIQYLASLAFVAVIVLPRLRHDFSAGTLLLVFWALRLPVLGAALAGVFERAAALRSTLLRLLEPLDAPEEGSLTDAATVSPGTGCALALRKVSVVAGGHPVLQDVDLTVEAGEHVAVIGASGAGKSTLLGLFLGWHAPATGWGEVDGTPLEGDTLAALRERTAWLDPTVRLWNGSLAANLLYGGDARALPAALRDSCLERLIDALPAGLETSLGEEGRLLSGGEGQKVRTARALAREASLVILDEPFRGLERAERRRLLERARQRWRGATLLCATHDLDDITGFDRVLVLEDGRIVEDGAPAALRESPSRYAALLEASEALSDAAWGPKSWRQLRLDSGVLERRP